MPETPYGKLLLTGCDWLTMTWPHKSTVVKRAGQTVFDRLAELEIEGWEMKERRAMQFHGYGSEKLQWLRNESHVMLRTSGYEANETAKRLIAENCSGKCTRIDLQVTADYGEREIHFASRMRESIFGTDVGHKTNRASKRTHFEGASGDTGITIGDRGSEKYFRIYHAASGGHPELPDGAIRFEGEYKADRAAQVWSMAKSASSLEVLAASITTGEMLLLGLKEPWFGDSVPVQLPAIADTRNIAKTLRWYETQVVPSLRQHVTGEHQEQIRRLFLDALYPEANIIARRKELDVPKNRAIFLGED
jgi:hypothetical protein